MNESPSVSIVSKAEVEKFTPILIRFMTSYANKSEEVTIESWLTQELHASLTDRNTSEIQSMAAEIITSVDTYTQNLFELNQACDDGMNKEAWLAHKIRNIADQQNVDMRDLGNVLQELNRSLYGVNNAFIQSVVPDYNDILNGNSTQWNELEILRLLLESGKQTTTLGLLNPVITETGFELAFNDPNAIELNNVHHLAKVFFSDNDDDIKKIATGALKVATELRIFHSVPTNTTVNTLAGIVSMSIENVKVYNRLAIGTMSTLHALESLSRNSIALFASISCEKIGTGIGASVFSFIPVIGTTVGAIVGGLIGRMVDSKIVSTIRKGIEKIKPIATSVARKTWNAVTGTVKSVGRTIASAGRAVASFFGF